MSDNPETTPVEQQPHEEETQENEDTEPSTSEAADYGVKHPLQSSWTLWYDYAGRRTSADSYKNYLRQVYTFSSVEDFWSVYNHIMKPSQLPAGSNYHLFKEGISPQWEHPANSKGGAWRIQFTKKYSEGIDDWWLYLVLACIGESFDWSDEICGCVVNRRAAGDRLQVWTKTATNSEACTLIGQQLRASLGLEKDVQCTYQSHADAMASNTPSRKPKSKYTA